MKTKSLLQPIEYIWSGDPAVDKTHPAYSQEEYLKDFDPKFRPVREGATPAVFKLAPLPRRVMLRILKLDKMEQLFECTVHSLCGVTGWEHNGREVIITKDDFVEEGKLRRLSESWVDQHFDVELFAELGGAAFAASGLRPL